MALQQIDRDTVQPNGKRGAPGRTAMGIVNQNAVETEQRLAALEEGAPGVGSRLDALDSAVESAVEAASSGLAQEAEARVAGDAAIQHSMGVLAGEVESLHERMRGGSYFINGDFRFWHRWPSGAAVSMAGYRADRFIGNLSNVTGTLSRLDFGPGNKTGRYGVRIVIASPTGSHGANYSQKLEGVGTLSGQQVVLSIKCKASVAGKKFGVRIFQEFGTGGGASTLTSTEIGVFEFPSTMNVVEIPFVMPSIAGKVVGTSGTDCVWVVVDLIDTVGYGGQLQGQTGTYDFDYWKIEPGSVATEFELRPDAVELELCQRYCETLSMTGMVGVTFTTNGDTRSARPFKTKKRSNPSLTYTGYLFVIGFGGAGIFLNVDLGSLNFSANTDAVKLGGVGNITALQPHGGVVTWGDSGGGACVVLADSEL